MWGETALFQSRFRRNTPRSNRLFYAVAFVCSVAFGLASRKYPWLFPAILGKYPGDALWALMVFCGWGFVQPDGSTGRLAVYALLTSYVDELSQLYKAPWIDAIRSTTAGHLILGSTFSWFDMLAYTAGVGIGAICKEARVIREQERV